MDADPLKRNGDNEVIRPKLVSWAPEQHAALRSPLETRGVGVVSHPYHFLQKLLGTLTTRDLTHFHRTLNTAAHLPACLLLLGLDSLTANISYK